MKFRRVPMWKTIASLLCSWRLLVRKCKIKVFNFESSHFSISYCSKSTGQTSSLKASIDKRSHLEVFWTGKSSVLFCALEKFRIVLSVLTKIDIETFSLPNYWFDSPPPHQDLKSKPSFCFVLLNWIPIDFFLCIRFLLIREFHSVLSSLVCLDFQPLIYE